jgi:hypothetical protein
MAARELPFEVPVAVNVRCEGSTHRVILNSRGRLTLPDHNRLEVRHRLAALKLGGTPCRCLKVLLAWRKAFTPGGKCWPEKLPRKLIDAVHQAWEVQDRRMKQRRGRLDELAIEKFRERPVVLREELRRLVARHCPAWEGCSLALKRPVREDAYTFTVTRARKRVGSFSIPPTWHQDVLLDGPAVYEGNLVIRVVPVFRWPCDRRITFLQPTLDKDNRPRLRRVVAELARRPDGSYRRLNP